MASERYVDIDVQCPDVGDIQAPLAGWLHQVRHALENPGGFGMCSIPKVPNSLRSPATDFTPVEWRFGLHNREALHTGGTESLKMGAASAFGLKGDEWDEFCTDVVDNPVELLKIYGVQSLDDVLTRISWGELKCLVTLDALFLVLIMECISEGRFIRSPALFTFFILGRLKFQSLTSKDIFLLENQIPMALLRKVIKRCLRRISDHEVTEEEEEELLDKMLKAIVRGLFPLLPELDTNEEVFSKNYPQGKLGQCEHILHCLYQVICGPDAVLEGDSDPRQGERDVNRFIAVESATTLEAAGIKIKAHQGTLDKTSFKNGVLNLPFLSMSDITVPLFRNLVLFEYFSGKSSTFGDYLQLMLNLIETPADVSFLAKREVIRNFLAAKACEHWHTLHEGWVAPTPSTRFLKLQRAINKHCESKTKTFSAEFIRLFCSKPWVVLSVITVTFVTLATGIQTYVNVIGSNRMEPHFPHG